jgi:hypothetical protein
MPRTRSEMSPTHARTAARAAGLDFYEGLPCIHGFTKRWVKHCGCACDKCSESRSLRDSGASVAVVRTHAAGQCRHGRRLREPCRDCEISWRREPRPERDARDEPYLGHAHVSMVGVHKSV